MNIQTKVLIVDDEPKNIKIIKEILTFEDDFICRSAKSGEIGLELMSGFYPDIVLLDIMMPGLDGYEVCRKIRASDAHKFVKVIMVSGKAMTDERLAGYAAGADDYITKPFVDDELLAKIRVFARLKKIEELDQEKSSILNLLGHEIKTSMNGILGISWIFKEIAVLPLKEKEYARLLHLSAERLQNLLDKCLLWCQLKGKTKLDLSSRQVDQFLNSIVDQKKAVNPKKITFSLECENKEILTVDWSLISKAMDYVLDNAIKYSPVQGKVFIFAGRKGNDYIIRIRDQGPGIEPEQISKIFNEFYCSKIMNHQEGTGLSLAIARLAMFLHNGSLEVDSKAGKGTSFTFTFPIRQVEI